MPGTGELALVSFGNQNVAINGNPEETKFYRVFKRYTHFSQENIAIPLEGPNELTMDNPIRLRAKIPRHADLMTDLAFVFDLPAMYSKLFAGYTTDNVPSPFTRVPAFRWIHMIGALIIDNLAIFVGGSKIQEFPGEWIAARATIDYPTEKYLKWRSMVGDVPELHSPEWGIYGKSPNYPFTKGEYPNVLDPSGSLVYAPSLPPRQIRVPLPFWFTEDWGRALPLVALQLHEVEVQLTLRPLRELYRIMDPYYQAEPVRPNRMIYPDPAAPTQIDPTLPAPPYDNLTLQNAYATTFSDTVAALRYYYTNSGQPVPAQEGFTMNAHLEANYVFLTEKEQIMFAGRELHHLVRQIQVIRYPSLVARTRIDLDIHSLTTRLVFWGRRSDAIQSRNDYINLSNWKNLTQAPFDPVPGAPPIPNSGLEIPYYSARNTIASVRLLLDGNELYEERPAAFFEVQVPFMNTTGTGLQGLNPGGLKPDDVMGPIYQFPFSLNASDHFQPSGSLNTSRLRNVQLEINPTQLDPNGYYVYDITVFAENLNTIKFMNGMASLNWAI
jgi:hypothetical protein